MRSSGLENDTKGGNQPTVDLLEATLNYARERNYTGPDYADGMSSALLDLLPGNNKWVNLVVQETVKRFPVDLRPMFGVEYRQSFKGTALFAMANQRAAAVTGQDRYAREQERLLQWLVANRSTGYAGFCGGHQHALQELDRRIEPGTPDVVSTAYATRALLEAEDLSDEWVDIALSAADFLLKDLGYTSVGEGARLRYRPTDDGRTYVLNANALAARTFMDLYAATGETDHRHRAEALLRYVASKQTDSGGWMYTDPPEDSHLRMDNHHNGFILESYIWHRRVTGSAEFSAVIERGLSFYRHTLFEPDGAPNWDESSPYPRDVHAAAQGIITFGATGNHEFADQILRWTVERLYAGDGQFRYQRRRWYTKPITLMRWCQAWMAFAIGCHLMAEIGEGSVAAAPREILSGERAIS
jgi:hypothetical protein